MEQISLHTTSGKNQWRAYVDRRIGVADPDQPRSDSLTIQTFGRPLSARAAVTEILRTVREQGDAALRRYAQRLDGWPAQSASLRVSSREQAAAARRVPETLKRALHLAARHIVTYHRRQKPEPFRPVARPGVMLQERTVPLRRVGLYVPGGNAPLVSTVLMNALPARVAGVAEIVMATPATKDGSVPAAILYAAQLAGVSEIYRVGGAAAVAGLAYGTQTIRAVEKIVGPGNIFVTEAKRQVVGRVGIDSLAGPSEIVIIADESASPEHVLWDLLAQSEHGSGAVAILISPSDKFLEKVQAAARTLHARQPSEDKALQSTLLVKAASLEACFQLSDQYGPEHLSLQIKNARTWLAKVGKAGAVFVGAGTAQAMGDYVAGTNHVLPTNGTAAWASALSLRDFVRTYHVVEYSAEGMRREGPAGIAIAEAEGLSSHAQSIRQRLAQPGKKSRGVRQ